MESDNISSELLQRLDRKPRWNAVKYFHSATVSDWCAHRDNTISGRFAGVDAICYLHILDYDQIQVGLGHPPQLKLEYSVPTVTYIIQYEPYWCLGFVPPLAPFPSPQSFTCTPAHYIPTMTFSPPLPPTIIYHALLYPPHSCLPCLITPASSCPARGTVPVSH